MRKNPCLIYFEQAGNNQICPLKKKIIRKMISGIKDEQLIIPASSVRLNQTTINQYMNQ